MAGLLNESNVPGTKFLYMLDPKPILELYRMVFTFWRCFDDTSQLQVSWCEPED